MLLEMLLAEIPERAESMEARLASSLERNQNVGVSYVLVGHAQSYIAMNERQLARNT